MARPIKKITEAHIEVAQLKQLGNTVAQIKEKTGFSEDHIKSILCTPKIKEFMAGYANSASIIERAGTVEDVLKRVTMKSILLLEKIIDDDASLGDTTPTVKQRLDAAIEVLGMAGYGKSVKVDHKHTHLLQGSDFDEIRRRSLGGNDRAIEVEATPIEALPELPGF